MSLDCSASVNLGSVAKACQYLRAAFAPRSGGASAEACPEGSPRMAVARHRARSMSGTSLREGWDGKETLTAVGFAVSVEQVGGDRGQDREGRRSLKWPGKRGHFRHIQAPSDIPPGGEAGGVLPRSECDLIRGLRSWRARDRVLAVASRPGDDGQQAGGRQARDHQPPRLPTADRPGAGRGGRGSAHAGRRHARAGARPSGRRPRRPVAT